MTKSDTKPFNRRAFLALTAAASGLALPGTGLALHVQREGAVAPGIDTWAAVHTILGLLFALTAGWHIVLNRRALRNYAIGLAGRVPAVSREALCAVLVVTLAMTVAAGHAGWGR